MNNSKPNSLGAIVDQHERNGKFLGNPFDAYESYTYNLELFVVDRTADRKFQLQESFTVLDVANNKWPGPNDNSVTIAKTGHSTEFNITDLTVESVYKGTNSNSKLATTATKLNFMITQIGATSLPENLQNAIAFCGYDSLFFATYYIKINFLGYDENGRQKTIENSTKVFAFNLMNYKDLQTASDQKGTATTLNGVIKQDEALTNETLNRTKVGFSYVVGDTLKETLNNFMFALNNSNVLAHPNLSENLQNTYSWDHSDQFEKYTKSPMKGEETSTNENMEKVDLAVPIDGSSAPAASTQGDTYDPVKEAFVNHNMRNFNDITINPGLDYYNNNIINNSAVPIIDMEAALDDAILADADNINAKKNYQASAKEVGQVLAGMNIYEIIQSICLSAVDVKEEIIASKSGLTEVLKISPWLVIKENGYNPVAGTNVYNIEYYIDYVLKEVIQNKLDDIDKKRYGHKTIQKWFDTGHVTKLYNYLFTGKNDQILDFDISLEKQLYRTYSKPTDAYAYQHFLNDGTPEGMFVSDAHKKLINEYETELKELKGIADTSKEARDSSFKAFNTNKNSFREKIIRDLTQDKNYLADDGGADIFEGMDLNQLTELAESRGIGELYTAEKENYDKLAKLYNASIKKYKRDSIPVQNKEIQVKTAITDAISSQLSLGNVGRHEASKEIFDSLNLNKGDSSRRNITLLEELDDDIISKLSNSDFEIILKNQANNPTSFQTLIGKLDENNGNYTLKSTSEENIELAREKYYEANRYDISMLRATMTIKGDPYWLEGVISPKQAKKLFGNFGHTGSSGDFLNLSTTQNGNNGCVVISGKADGVDLNDNILVKNLITHLYMVTHVISSFTGGRFTQTLQMIRKINADAMISTPGDVGPSLEEIGDKNTSIVKTIVESLSNHDNFKIANTNLGVDINGDPILKYIDDYTDTEVVALINKITTLDKEAYANNSKLSQADKEALWQAQEDAEYAKIDAEREALKLAKKKANHWSNSSGEGSITSSMNHADAIRMNKLNAEKKAEEAKAAAVEADRISTMKAAMSEYKPRIGVFEPDMGRVGDEVKKLADDLVENADLAVELHVAAVTAPELPIGPIVRQANAAHYLNALPGMTRACRAEQKRGIIPFVSCEAIETHNKKILAIFETTPGVTPTIAEINAHLNNEIADAHPQNAGAITESSTTINNGVITDIDDGTGVYRRDRGLITENSVDTKYSDYEIAQFQIAAGGVLSVDGHDPADIERIVRESSLAKTPVIILDDQAKGDVSSDVSSEQGFGADLDNSILEGFEPLVVKASTETRINVPPKLPMTEAEYEAKYETIRDDTNCVGQCRTRKLMLLGKEYNDAVKEQYYIDKKIERTIKKAKGESKGGWFANAWNKTLQVVGFEPETFTETEHADRIVLTEGINDILTNNALTSDEVIARDALIVSAVQVLDADIKDNNLIISDTVRNATVGAIVEKVSNEAALNAISEDDYSTVKAYENAVNNIVVEANTGHRADLGYAVNVATTQGEIAALSAKHDVVTAKSYYFDPADRRADAKLQAQLEEELALLAIAQPDETITGVATIETAGITQYIPIYNPVAEIEEAKQPLVVLTPLSTYDIILPGSLKEKLAAVGGDSTMLSQYSEAQKIYKLITNMDDVQMKVVTDDAGVKIKVKDFSKVGLITYTDANGASQTIDPVALFNLHTTTYDDMNPTYARDYNTIKAGIADLFPNISTVDKNLTVDGVLLNDDGTPKVIMYDSFYVTP